VQDKKADSYQILSCTDIPQYEKCDLHVNYFNNKHELVKNTPLPLDRKKYDYVDLLDAESTPGGLNILMTFYNISQNATSGTSAGKIGSPTIYDHIIGIYFVPNDSNTVLSTTVDLSTDTYPFYAFYTENPLSNALNVLLLSYREIAFKEGLEWQPAEWMKQMIFKIDHRNLNHINIKKFEQNYANYYIKSQTDPKASFEGLPIKMATNRSGESSVVSVEYSRKSESAGRIGSFFSYIRDIAITRLDGGNSENDAIVLPLNQALSSRTGFYNPYDLSHKGQIQKLFTTTEDSYNRQFLIANVLTHNDTLILIYNDNPENFDNSINKPGDTVYDFRHTNACYNMVTESNKVTKKKLFGNAAPTEFKNVFIEGAFFDEQRNTYAALTRCQSGNAATLCMSWSHFE
jgi:hypothetical protein